MRKLLIATTTVALGMLFLAMPSAHATTSCLETRTSTAHLVDRPDGGNHGTWALDDLQRTTIFCEITPGVYHATVLDVGTFETLDGALSPNAGAPISQVTTGSVNGGFTADFQAAEKFATYSAVGMQGTFHGTEPSSTSTWVEKFFSDVEGSLINDDWSWTYKSCSEQWTDAASNNDGTAEGAGDITGKLCPQETTTTTAVAPTTTARSTPTTTSGGTATPTTLGTLPFTGTSHVKLLVSLGIIFALFGVALLVWARSRRTS